MTLPLSSSLTALFAALCLAACSGAPEAAPAPPEQAAATPPAAQATQTSPSIGAVRPAIQGYEIVTTYPHDTTAFTQGLFFWEGILYESTGQYGESTVRKTVIETGEVTAFRDIARCFHRGCPPRKRAPA